jgi:[ribosomal protein S5]-alanine N-acetyltransferase
MLETNRLIIRPFTDDDLDRLIEMRADPDVNKYLGGTRLQNPEAIAKRLKVYISTQEKYGFSSCALIWKETGEMIGWGGLMPLEESGEIEVGYGFIKEFWGKGLGTEMTRAWLDHAFGPAGLERVVAIAIPGNDASTHIMEKVGMRYEKNALHYGEDCLFYAVTRDEYLLRGKK